MAESYRKAQKFDESGNPVLDSKGNPIIVTKKYTQIDAWLDSAEGVGFRKLNQHGLPVGQGRGNGIVRTVHTTSSTRAPQVPTVGEVIASLIVNPRGSLVDSYTAVAAGYLAGVSGEDANALTLVRESIVKAYKDAQKLAGSLAKSPSDTESTNTLIATTLYASRTQAALVAYEAAQARYAEYTATQEARTAQQIAEDETRAQMRELQARLRELRGQSTTRKAASA